MPETEKNFGQRNGERIRNAGLLVSFGGLLLAPEVIIPALLVAAGGEGLKQVSKNK